MRNQRTADRFFTALWLVPSAVAFLLSMRSSNPLSPLLGFGFFWLIFGILPWIIFLIVNSPPPRTRFWTPPRVKRVRLILLIAGLTVAHFYYDFSVGHRLFELRGAFRKMPIKLTEWTNYRAIDKAWTIPTDLPLCVFAKIIDKLDAAGLPYLRCVFAPVFLVLILAPSTVGGWVLASLIVAVCRWERPVFGRYFWRLWLLLLSWGWILVPVELSLVYQYTVRY